MKTYRALIVEDAVDVRRALKAALELTLPGFTVADVPSAEEGMLEFFRQSVDLLVTDFLLPGMTGFELIERMHVRKPEMKIIVVTGQLDPEYRAQALAWGADAFFQKPLEIMDFVACVRDLLQIPEINPLEDEAGSNQTQPGLDELLKKLQQEIDASAVLLLDIHGSVAAQVGEYLDYDQSAPYVSVLLGVVAESQRLSLYFGRAVPQGYFKIYGKEIALMVNTVGEGHLLISVLPVGREIPDLENTLQVNAERLQIILSQSDPIVETEVSAGMDEQARRPEQEELDMPEVEDESLGVLIANPEHRKIKLEEVDAFWEEMESEEHTPTSGNAEMLTYEEARRLGLTPGQKGPVTDDNFG